MIPDFMEKIFQAFRKMSEREQRLALATAAVVLLFLVFMAYQRAQERLDSLSREIDRLEENLMTQTRLLAHRDIIESEYAAIAAQHSSEWSEAEIHDRLRQEIYRLARNTPPPLDENGIPVPTGSGDGNLVEIPSLGQGQMSEGGQGYREYRINFRVPTTRLENIIKFLERLHNSPQSLRIDALDLNRSPESELVSASIDITRIVADGAAALPAVPADAPQVVATAAPTSDLGRITLNADDWQAIGATVENAQDGVLDIRLTAAAAEVYMPYNLPGGGEYEMLINMGATSPTLTMGVGTEPAGQALTSMQPLDGDGQQRQYQAQFTAPGNAPTVLRCPWIRGGEPGAVVRISGLMVRAVSEVYQ